MGEGLLSLWKLGAPVQPATASDAQGATAFRDAIASVNASLQSAITGAPTEQHAALAADRSKLYEAYQVASSRFAEDEAAGKDAMQRVVAAAGTLLSKAATATAEGAEAKQQWAERQAEFDEALRQIGELEDTNHPKSATLRQLAESIRTRIGDQQFGACVAAFDALAPKLAELVGQQIEPQTPNAGDAATTSNLATLEVRVSYQGTAVPGAMVRLTGPTKSPDTSTNAAGVAQFVGVEPGKYFVNAAKQAFVFQPAQVPQGALAPGAVHTVNITKAAQGQPPAPGYLYTGGGSAKPTTPPSPSVPPQPTTPSTPSTPSQPTTPISPSTPSQPAVPVAPSTDVATVEIHVIDENGAPVEQAMVRISTGPTTPPDAKTSAAGIARFQLVPGEYHVNAAKRDVVWQPAYIAASKLQPGTTYPVTLNKPRYPEPTTETSSLTVCVAWNDGKPVDSARVDIDGNPKWSAPTDSSGAVHFDKLPVGPHSVQATHVSLEYGTVSKSEMANVTKDKQLTTSIKLYKNTNLCGIDVYVFWDKVLPEDEYVSYVEGALVTINPANAGPAVVGKRSPAKIQNVPEGTYTVTAIVPQTGQTITASNVVVNTEAQYGTTRVDMHARHDADPTNPPANAHGKLRVTVYREGSKEFARNAVISLSPALVPPLFSDLGSVTFESVPVGEYKVTAEVVQSGGQQARSTAHVTIQADVETSTGLVVALPGGELIVTVYDQDNSDKGIAGALVSVSGVLDSQFTNASGIAQFHDVPPGNCNITVSGKVLAPPVTRSIDIEPGRTHSVTIPMSAEQAPQQIGDIYVSVSTPGGKDLDFTVVSISPNVHAPQMAGTGQVKFTNIPCGEYVVEATLNTMVARQSVRLVASGSMGGYASAHLVLSNHGDSGGSLEDLVIA